MNSWFIVCCFLSCDKSYFIMHKILISVSPDLSHLKFSFLFSRFSMPVYVLYYLSHYYLFHPQFCHLADILSITCYTTFFQFNLPMSFHSNLRNQVIVLIRIISRAAFSQIIQASIRNIVHCLPSIYPH